MRALGGAGIILKSRLDQAAVERALGAEWGAANGQRGAASVVMPIKAINAAAKAA